MNFIVTVFDDNPQTYIELDGYKYITHQYRAPIYLMPPFKQKFDTRHDIPGMIFSEAIQMLLYHELAHIGGAFGFKGGRSRIWKQSRCSDYRGR